MRAQQQASRAGLGTSPFGGIWDRLPEGIAKRRELILYGLIGGTAVVIDFSVFVLAHTLAGLPTLVAHTLSVGAAVLFSFTVNAKWNFRTEDRLATRFLSFAIVAAVGYLIGGVLLVALQRFDLSAEAAKAISLPVVAIVQYLLNSRITFAATKES